MAQVVLDGSLKPGDVLHAALGVVEVGQEHLPKMDNLIKTGLGAYSPVNL